MGVREKSFEFQQGNRPLDDIWIFPLLSIVRDLAGTVCVLRLVWLVLTGPGTGEISTVGTLPSLLSTEADGLLLGSLAEDASSEAHASAH